MPAHPLQGIAVTRDMHLADALEEFLIDRESRLLRPATIRFYRTHVGAFVRFLEDGEPARIDAVTRGAVRHFFAHLARRVHAGDLSPATVAAYDRALRAFCVFCAAEGWLTADPMRGRRRVRPNARLPDTWSLDEVRALLATCDGIPIGVRDRALTCRPLTPNGLNQMIRRRVKRAGVPMKRKLCHIWRHTFARMYVQNGGDVETLRRILGHASIETTRVYLGFRDAEVAQQHARFSPVRQLVDVD